MTLLPVAPAADSGGGGKIAGDPIFDVTDIGVALDQLAREILRHLKDHKLTVVWLFDESTSMQDDQNTIRQKFDRVSSELKVNVEPGKKPPAHSITRSSALARGSTTCWRNLATTSTRSALPSSI